MNRSNRDKRNSVYATNEMKSDSINYQNNEDNDNRYNNNIESHLSCKSVLNKFSKDNKNSTNQDSTQRTTHSKEHIDNNKVTLNSPSKSLLHIKRSQRFVIKNNNNDTPYHSNNNRREQHEKTSVPLRHMVVSNKSKVYSTLDIIKRVIEVTFLKRT